MPILKNHKHEAFCQAIVAGKTQEQAYAEAGYKPSRHHAARLATNGNIRERIEKLQHKVAVEFEITVEEIAKMLREDRKFAIKCKSASAATAATMGLAKLGGLLVDHGQINVSHSYSTMSEEEIRFELAALAAEARALKPGVQH
jgi:hypothetical protein